MNRMVLIGCGILMTLAVGCQDNNKQTAATAQQDLMAAPTEGLQQQMDDDFTNAELHYQLGKRYHAEGQYDKAEWEYKTAARLGPLHYRSQAAAVKVLLDAKQKQQADQTAQQYMNRASISDKDLAKLAAALQQEGLSEYALAAYQQALGLSPNSALLHRQIGFHYLVLKDPVRAEEHLRASIELDPYQPEVAEQLGRMGVVVQPPVLPTPPSMEDAPAPRR